MMHFYIYRPPRRPKPKTVKYPAVFLFDDSWDDFGYKTLFDATIKLSADSDEVHLGSVKILETAAGEPPIYSPRVEDRFSRLDTRFCSLGQSVSYYRHLASLPAGVRKSYLTGLRDIVSRPTRRDHFSKFDGFETSLLRFNGARDALRRGGYYIGFETLEAPPPKFEFVMMLPGAIAPHEVNIDFTPHNGLPHRTNLLIGRNGTGKTQLLAHLAQSLYGTGEIEKDSSKLRGGAQVLGDSPEFAKIIAISYSAFDQFPIPDKQPRQVRKSLFDYKYCGLRNAAGAIDARELKTMLDSAMEAVEREDRTDTLRGLIERLLGSETSGNFVTDKPYRDELFERLSAGQRFIVAVAADVVGFIEERSIILFDEPETHLHPGLLSTMLAILEEILREFHSFALIATHSPILLQQVPRRYVRWLKRRGVRTSVSLPPLETFGEDLGELTRRVLDLAEPEKDFHAIIDRWVQDGETGEAIRAKFDREMPLPVQIYLDSILPDQDV